MIGLFRFKNASTAKIVLFGLVVMLLWGSLYPMVKIGYAAFCVDTAHIPSIILFAGIRFVLCGIILLLIACASEKRAYVPKKRELLPILGVALSTIVLHYSFTYIALSMGDSSKSAIIKQTGFLFLSCFAFLFDKNDRFTWRKALAGVLGFLGIIATSTDGGFSFGLAEVLLVLSSACSAISAVITKKATQYMSPSGLVAYSQLIGGAFLLALGIALGGHAPVLSGRALLVMLYICFSSVVAYLLWNLLLKYGDISTLSVVKFAEPLFAVLLSGLFLREDILKWSYGVALLLILVSILLINQRKKKDESHRI